jgi:hypothetical protein
MPRLYADGVLLVGDAASFLNGQRIKGIHTAMKSECSPQRRLCEHLVMMILLQNY